MLELENTYFDGSLNKAQISIFLSNSREIKMQIMQDLSRYLNQVYNVIERSYSMLLM